MLLLLVNMAFATTVTRSMVTRVSPGDDVTVTLSVAGATVGDQLAIRDNMPFAVTSWTITGAEENKTDTLAAYETGKYSWVFTPTVTNPMITYTMTTGAAGTYDFTGVYFDKSGMGNINDQTGSVNKLIVGEKKCGDGICEGDENCETCLADCPCASNEECINGICVAKQQETTTTTQGGQPTKSWPWIISGIIIILILWFIYRKV